VGVGVNVSNQAQALVDTLQAILGRAGLPAATAVRLLSHAARHLPLDAQAEGSPFIPPMYALRTAEALALDASASLAFAAAGCLFFAAADLADDCADGDERTSPAIDINDTCLLIFACQRAVAELPVGAEVRMAVSALFADAGLKMAVGQEADIRGTDTWGPVDPLAIARGKSGAELAAFFAGPALLAGQDHQPWHRFGEAFGALVQVLTDAFDLFLDHDSDDWATAKPTLAIRHGLAHPQHAQALALLLAGDRTAADRRTLGRWHLVQAGAGARLAEATAGLESEMIAAEVALDRPPALAAIREEIVGWCTSVVEALAEYIQDAAPLADAPARELAECRAAARQFLATDPLLEEATEVHRHGLFGAQEVRGGLFGRAVALDALAGEGLADGGAAARAAAFALADVDGWRYYPGHLALPTDADCVGVMMQLAAGTPEARHPAHRKGEALLLRPDNQDADGLFYTWLADPPRAERAAIDAIWAGEVCPGAAANALLGLWRRDPGRLVGVVRPRALALARRLQGPEAPHSAFYGPVGVDYMAGRALSTLASALELSPTERSLLATTQADITRRLLDRERISGHFGDVLETALAGWLLGRWGALRHPSSVVRALVDAQEADGGYPAARFYRTVPHPVTVWYGSRVVTTAYVLQALRLLEPHR